MYSDVCDDITDFEVCGFTKNTKIYLENETFFLFSSSNEKLIHQYIKGYNVTNKFSGGFNL